MTTLLCAIPAVSYAADVEITANTGAVDLDGETGSTVHVASGILIGPSSPALKATLQAWTITNDGSISGGNTVTLNQGGTFFNTSDATVSGTATALTFGYKPIGMNPTGGPGTLENYGTITGGVEGVTFWYGGAVNNYLGGTITTATGLNAVSIGQGASRSLFNAGTIESTRTTGFSTGVLIQGGPATFTNTSTGVIFGDYNGVYASATGVFTSFDNAGSIKSTRGSAVEATGGGLFTNSGIIESTNSNGILTRNTLAAEIINSGTISGAVDAINFTASGGGAVGAIHTVRLRTGSVINGNVRGGTGADHLVLEGNGSESIGKFLNFETLSMQGVDWSLTGTGAFTTSASIELGDLSVDGVLTSPAVLINPSGTLSGGGTIIGAVTNQGTINAGNSIGTLSVQGSLIFEAGSALEVEVEPTGLADLISVTGTATINGGDVSVLAASGSYAVSTPYTILSTTAGRTGVFSGVVSNFAFLAPTLSYDDNNVYLTLEKNGIDFDAIGGTPNQRATGSGVQSLEGGNPVYDAVLMLDIPEAREAFDQLSGEIHASVAGLFLDDSRHVREAALGRLRVPGAESAPLGAWGQAYGSFGQRDGDGNAADFNYHSGGLFAGVDVPVNETWRLGGLVGYSRATFDVDDRYSSGSANSFHVAAYGGGTWSDFSLGGGAAYAWHDVDTRRSVNFTGFSDNLSAGYDAHTAQIFGEASYAFHIAEATVTPLASLAYVDVATDSFHETGGSAALASKGADASTTFSTLGVRGVAPFEISGFSASATGFIGWRHAYDAVVPNIDMAFAGGDAFALAGTPIARDAAALELGLEIRAGASSRLGLGYSGQFGDGSTSQAFQAAFRTTF